MIQSGAFPSVGRSRVTRIAIGGKSCLLMTGRGCTIVVVDVTGRAIGRQTRKLPIRVTVDATGRSMLTPKRESIVLEDDGSSPVHRARMAGFAFRRETCGDMIRLLDVLVVRKVTSTALSGNTCESALFVTLSAFGGAMSTLQAKTCHHLVIPATTNDLLPALWRVTVLALAAQLQTVSVILSPNPVAGFTCLGSALYDSIDMALSAFHRSVPAHQGEIRIVV